MLSLLLVSYSKIIMPILIDSFDRFAIILFYFHNGTEFEIVKYSDVLIIHI